MFRFYKFLKRKPQIQICGYAQWRWYSPESSKQLNVMFFGTDNFSLPSLKILTHELNANGTVRNIGVATSFKYPVNPVKKYADREGLELFAFPLKEHFQHEYDIGVVVSFGYLLPKWLIDSFPLGMINVHASLLPRWRGAAPIIYSILNGETSTGVTIMKIHPHKFDIGEILAQEKVDIVENSLLPEVYQNLALIGSNLLIKCIRNLDHCYANARQQNELEASYAPKIDKNLPQIRWTDYTSTEIYNLYRALYSYRHLTTQWHGQTIKILDMKPLEREPPNELGSTPPGHIYYNKLMKTLIVSCKDKSYLDVRTLQVEGKRTISALDFNNGFVKKKPKEMRFFD